MRKKKKHLKKQKKTGYNVRGSGSLSFLDSEALKEPHPCNLFIDLHSAWSHLIISQVQNMTPSLKNLTFFVIRNLVGQVFRGEKQTCQSIQHKYCIVRGLKITLALY